MPDKRTHSSRALISIFSVSIFALSCLGQPAYFESKVLTTDNSRGDSYGNEVAIDGCIIAIAAILDDDNGFSSGSAFLFDVNSGEQLHKLLPLDGSEGDEFGSSLDVSDGLVAVGAAMDTVNGNNSGSAYIFDVTTGSQVSKLLPADGSDGSVFGKSIAIDNGIAAVGAWGDDSNGRNSGSVYLFDAMSGLQLMKLIPSDSAAQIRFGQSVAMSNGLLAVGSNRAVSDGVVSGAVYIFDVQSGQELAKLVADDGSDAAEFGWSVAMDGNLLVAGAHGDNDQGPISGSAYVFDLNSYSQVAKLQATDTIEFDYFGRVVSIDGELVAVGSPFHDDAGSDAGAVYLFDALSGEQRAKLLASDSKFYDYFGNAIAINAGRVVAGAEGSDVNGTNSGSAYLLEPCVADLTCDNNVDADDLTSFMARFNGMEASVDFTGDGTLDIFDVFAFLDAFNAGCP